VCTACDEHLTIGQQCRRVMGACGGEVSRGRPGPAHRIIELSAGEIAADVPACDEHLAIGQQRCRMLPACGGKAAGDRPGPAGRIVEFCAREIATETETACNKHLAVSQQCRCVELACDVEVACGCPT